VKKAVRFLLPVLLLSLGVALVEGQRGRFRSFSPLNFGRGEDPTTEFAMVRWYSSGWRGDGWSHDYPTAEEHILQIIHEVSGIDTNRLSYKIVDLASPEIFKYPFSYVSHPGDFYPSDQEIVNLREYVERGGFVMHDDFGGQGQGPWEMDSFKDVLRRAFPGREMYPLKEDHELLRLFFGVDSFNMIHPMSGAKSTFYGFNDSKGNLAMLICYANDVGDYWEFIDQPRYPVKPSAEALKLGVNMALYMMTH
jgi:hypothetical protein